MDASGIVVYGLVVILGIITLIVSCVLLITGLVKKIKN